MSDAPDEFESTPPPEDSFEEDQNFYGTRRRTLPPPPAPALQPSPRARRGYACADMLAAVFLLLTVMVILLTVVLINNPLSPLNPFPPPTFKPMLVIATSLPTDTPTNTPTPVPPTPTLPTPTPTWTPTITLTPTATITNTPVVGGIIPVGSTPSDLAVPTARAGFLYNVARLYYQKNTNSAGCNYQSVAGIVLDARGQPLRTEEKLRAYVRGRSGNIDENTLTGDQPAFGPSGFEVFVDSTPRISDYTVQLFNAANQPVSDQIAVQTSDKCDQNVVVIVFQQSS